jgi:hypothetical protein
MINENDLWELWAEDKPIATMRLHERVPPIGYKDDKVWMLGVMIFKDFEELPAFDRYWTRFDEYQDLLDAAFAEENDADFEKAYETAFKIYMSWLKPLRLQVKHPASGTVYNDNHMTLQVMDNWSIHMLYDVKVEQHHDND